MKLRLFVAAIIALFIAEGTSQTQPSQEPTAPHHKSFAVVTQLDKTLDAKKLKAGDKVAAQVIQDVIVQGKVLIPRESKIVGHVEDVGILTKTDPRSRLSLIFERAKLKDGKVLQIHGAIQALGPPLPDPFLEAAMASSSPYSPGETGHPVNGGLMSTGQSNAPTQITQDRPRPSAARALEQRERALDSADRRRVGGLDRNGALGVNSHGVFGIPGVFLSTSGPVATLISVGKNVDLKNGSQLVLLLDPLPMTTGK